jgi:hypothetical protein
MKTVHTLCTKSDTAQSVAKILLFHLTYCILLTPGGSTFQVYTTSNLQTYLNIKTCRLSGSTAATAFNNSMKMLRFRFLSLSSRSCDIMKTNKQTNIYTYQSAFPTNAHHLLHEIFTTLAYMFRPHGPSSGQMYKGHRDTVTYYTYKPCLWCVVDLC